MPILIDTADVRDGYDFVFIGSGFGSLFFLKRLLDRLPPSSRVLVLERGTFLTHAQQLALASNAADPTDPARALGPDDFVTVPQGHKPWIFTIGLGGGTLCWWGQCARLHPADFELRSRYGVGADWPLTYEDLEPYYCDAEDIMAIAGDSDRVGPYWRSRPYPLPAFLPSDADAAVRAHHPALIAIPTARTSVPTGPRSLCCAYAYCKLCPNDAKFTALNGLADVLDDARVSILIGAEVSEIETVGGLARAVHYRKAGRSGRVRGDHVILGANAIFNPVILKRSGLDHPELGAGINEQVSAEVEVKLTRLSGINGGTSATGLYTGLADGDDRRDRGASVFWFENSFIDQGLRPDRGKHLNTLRVVVNAEDLRSPSHYVEVPDDINEPPVVHHAEHTDYGLRGLYRALDRLPELFAHLEVDEITAPVRRVSESHIQCSTPCGSDPATSIVDGNLVHHQIRNLSVVGTSVFSTCPPATPSLTAAALSLRAADRLLG